MNQISHLPFSCQFCLCTSKAGQIWPTLALASLGWPNLFQAGRSRPTLALASLGWPNLKHRWALTSFGRPWSVLDQECLAQGAPKLHGSSVFGSSVCRNWLKRVWLKRVWLKCRKWALHYPSIRFFGNSAVRMNRTLAPLHKMEHCPISFLDYRTRPRYSGKKIVLRVEYPVIVILCQLGK